MTDFAKITTFLTICPLDSERFSAKLNRDKKNALSVTSTQGVSGAVEAPHMQNYHINSFISSIPAKPYCSDDVRLGVQIRSAKLAIKQKYIQHNSPFVKSFLIFDYDKAGVLLATDDANLPPANWITENRDTRRGHIAYALKHPVFTSELARLKPLKYASAIEKAYIKRLGSDPAYSNYITKNPASADWHTVWGREELYTLEELAEALPFGLPNTAIERHTEIGLGRNVSLFDTLRKWAYKNCLKVENFELWTSTCYAKALTLNTFSPNLDKKELEAIAKSVAKWTFRSFGKGKAAEAFKKRQSFKGKLSVEAKRRKNKNLLTNLLKEV